MNSFTEATPVYRVISAPPYAFAATGSGLDQWDLRSGRRIRGAASSQLFQERISDLAYDAERSVLWVVGSDGIARYDLVNDSVTEIIAPETGASLSALGTSVVALAPGGELLLGVASSVFEGGGPSGWRETALGAPVAALHADDDGIYVGTGDGLFALRGEVAQRLECDLSSVRLLLPAPGGGVLAVGAAEAGAQRIAIIRGDRCDSFRASPERRWLDAASDRDRAIVLTERTVFELSVDSSSAGVRSLSRRGMTLIPIAGERDGAGLARSSLRLRLLDAAVPPGAQTVAVSDGELLVGTQSLGTARLSMDSPRGTSDDSRWLRRQELAEHAALLTVHCDDEAECRLANGSGELWRFDGDGFYRRAHTARVLGIVDVSERALAVVRGSAQSTVEIVSAPSTGELAERVALAQIRVPSDYELRRLRAAPRGALLLGWKPPEAGEREPLSLIQLARTDGTEARTIGVGGAAMHDAVGCSEHLFVATDIGIYEVTTPTPRLVANVVSRRLVCDRGQLVAATDSAIVRRIDGTWIDVVAIDRPVRDFAVAQDGRVFVADDAGLGIWDGNRIRRYDVRRGLLENDVREIALDRFGRVWIRGATSVGLFRL